MQRTQRQAATRWTATVLTTAGLLLTAGGIATAQDATPAAPASHDHPAHIHLGTCDALDPNPTFMLTDVTLPATATDTASAIPVERSATTVDASLEDLRTGGYAINVHHSVDDIGTYIACGSLNGAIDADGALIVGLGELNASGHCGIAVLTARGEKTDVTVYLTDQPAGETGTTSAQSNATATADATAASVTIENFAYNPNPIEIAAGTTMTWTNNDTVPHTATATDRTVLQSGTLQPSDSFSQIFTTPGTYDYFCEFHANMKGTIVVQ